MIRETALRVTTRSALDASALAYQAVRIVRRKRNATAESTTPRMVRNERVLLRRKALRSVSPGSVM